MKANFDVETYKAKFNGGAKSFLFYIHFNFPGYANAAIAASQGAKQFLIVSALGADIRSKIFYNRVKGEVEQAVAELPFKTVHIFRPSILLGDRRESRPGERFGIVLMKMFAFLMIGSWRKYRPIKAEMVAEAMVAAAKANRVGPNIYESDAIRRMGSLNS